jgi:hypothetical protein
VESPGLGGIELMCSSVLLGQLCSSTQSSTGREEVAGQNYVWGNALVAKLRPVPWEPKLGAVMEARQGLERKRTHCMSDRYLSTHERKLEFHGFQR